MDARRFDTLSGVFADRRYSRRAALRAGSAGIATAVGAATGVSARAQDATPAASPDPLAMDGDRTYFLFVQVATSGSFTPKAGEDGVYRLVLQHGASETVYFSDRPERIVGTVPTARFLAGLGFTPANPPNAALVAGEEVVVVELLDPVMDEASGVLMYDVRVLDAYEEEGLAHLAAQSTATLPESFGSASLFIDDCPDVSGCLDYPAGARSPVYVAPIPDGINTGQCWHLSSFSCRPCNGWSEDDYANACNETYSQCNGLCYVDTGGI